MPHLPSTKDAYISSPDAWHSRGRSRAPRMPRVESRGRSKVPRIPRQWSVPVRYCKMYSVILRWKLLEARAMIPASTSVQSGPALATQFSFFLAYFLPHQSWPGGATGERSIITHLLDAFLQPGSSRRRRRCQLPPAPRGLSLGMAPWENNKFPAQNPQWSLSLALPDYHNYLRNYYHSSCFHLHCLKTLAVVQQW